MVATMKLLFVTSIFIAFSFPINAERGYLLTAPKEFHAGSSERLCLTLTDVKERGQVRVRLLQERKDIAIAEKLINYPSEDPCFLLEIPNTNFIKGRFEIKGRFGSVQYDFDSDDDYLDYSFDSDQYTFDSETKVSIKSRSTLTFVQTDKAVYKPGQKVQFRILTVNHVLEPDSTEISKIFIENPKGIRIAQWLAVKNENGLIQLDMQLSDEAPKGTWKISAQVQGLTKEQSFEVDEYVLPKFEVKVVPPRFLLPNMDSATWKICAKYTYGKNVQGTSTIVIGYRNTPLNEGNIAHYPHEKYEVKVDGCYELTVNKTVMRWYSALVDSKYIGVTSSVKEDGTGVEFTDSSVTLLHETPLKIDFEARNNEKYFRPGLPYFGKLVVKHPDKQAAFNALILICHKTKHLTECRNFTSDINGMIKFTIPPQKPEVQSLQISASAALYKSEKVGGELGRLIQQPSGEMTLKPWYSPTGSFMDVKPVHDVISCGEEVPLEVLYTTSGEDITLHYEVMSRGRIVDYGKKMYKYNANDYKEDAFVVRNTMNISNEKKELTNETVNYILPGSIGKFHLPIKMKAEMSPIARVLVYYIRSNSEVISAFATLDVMPCFLNKVSLNFEKNSIKPGTLARYKISASAKSLCAVGVVDKSVHLLKSSNQITVEKIFNILKSFDATNDNVHCRRSRRRRTRSDARIVRSVPFAPRPSRTEFADAPMSFEFSGLTYLTDNAVGTLAPCRRIIRYRKPVNRIQEDSRGRNQISARRGANRPSEIAEVLNADDDDNAGVNEAAEVRAYFPETWLWDLEIVGDGGYADKEAEIPHTITEWVGSMFCTSKAKGLGVSPPATIKAFQPFFVSYTLPYSVIRKEKVPIVVSVFNYLPECLPIQIKLQKNEGFTLLSNNYTHSMCVCGGKPATHQFRILPTSLGEVNLTVYSHSFNDSNKKICPEDKNASALIARDAITKPLLVEPEGFPQELTESVLFCPSEHQNGFEQDFEFMLPHDLVEGSARAFFSITGDIMGPSLSGLERLVALPIGCGEQNMIRFAPNIFVMQYLQGTNNVTKEIEKKALKFMKTGYQRQLNYRHSDGSYSAFGENDPEGSSWLTAFVVKSFAQARQFIDIDPIDLKKSTEWLLSKQQADGCFPFIGMVHHQDMKGGIGKNVPTALTAYVVISLLESETPIGQDQLDKAFECITKETAPSQYTVALTAYAYTLAGRYNLTEKLLDDLFSKSSTEGRGMYWPTSSKSVSIELGSYVILSLMKLGGAANKVKAMDIVRWIARQRNSNGGFVSTQDTVLALQAFAKYSVTLTQNAQDVAVTAKANGFDHTYAVKSTNRLLMQTDKIEELPNIVDVQATGSGCGLIQTTLKYNRNNVNASEAFELSAVGNTHKQGCKLRTLDICATYKIPKENSNMAVITVKMISGYIPVKDSLARLKKDKKLNLKRFEVDANYVNFYFDFLGNEKTCFTIHLEKEIDVEDAKPATISVFDYYISELKLEKSYSLPSVANCF
uniref:TEP1-F n=1 Tax=Ammothea sp. RS-2014 TaxID=1569307 RepID=A0A0E4FMX6_9CHEL|nr:alpha-2-macroglobulin 4 [Ammothea sp. RS-2014]